MSNNNNVDDDDEQQQEEQEEQEEQQPQLLQLIGIEEWFNIDGVRAASVENNEGNDDEHEHEEHGDQREIRHQVNLEREYQIEMHAKIFNAEDNKEEKGLYPGSSCCSPNSKRRRRQQQLDELGEDAIDILTTMNIKGTEKERPVIIGSNLVVLRANLKELASRSDTVFAMASNKHLYNNSSINKNDRLSLSLCDYSTESVKIFLRVLFPSPSSPSQDTDNDTDSDNDNEISPDNVIDCCRLAHYLQCQQLLDRIVNEYLLTSIDNGNCRFLCKLSDELSLPNLWEASVNHMLSSLDQFNSNNNDKRKNSTPTTIDENCECDDDDDNNNNDNLSNDMTPELKKEIQALRGILKSSNRKQIYFSTYHEYLALLAEQHQYYKERLQDAKDSYTVRLEEETDLVQELKSLQEERTSNWFDGGYTNLRLDRNIANVERRIQGVIKAREYVKPKIDRQTRKVNTLKTLLEEQKTIFGGGSGGSRREDIKL
mmetsp:Transcript_50957/g.56921  ORF Transcript_50957/g.56921 Transcript_50957/m.56921 type:complete len:485 (+) Transcript_50957:61-1515(+)